MIYKRNGESFADKYERWFEKNQQGMSSYKIAEEEGYHQTTVNRGINEHKNNMKYWWRNR